MTPELMASLAWDTLNAEKYTVAERAEFRAWCIRDLQAKGIAVDPHATLPMIAHLCELIAGMRKPAYVEREPVALPPAAQRAA